jgi:hypothetical protein
MIKYLPLSQTRKRYGRDNLHLLYMFEYICIYAYIGYIYVKQREESAIWRYHVNWGASVYCW